MGLEQYRNNRTKPDWLLAILAFGLSGFGLAMILSASAYLAGRNGDVMSFVKKQLLSLAIGFVCLLATSICDYRAWKAIAGPLITTLVIVLLAVFISPECRGVHRCLIFGPIRFQPAEFVKLGFLIYLSAWLARLGPKIQDFRDGFVNFAILVAIVGGLVILEPDMGTAMTVVLAAVLMYFLAGAPWHHFGVGALVGVGLIVLLIIAAPYRAKRLETYLNPSSDVQGAGYQTNQIGIAIGSGGLWGLGFGQGKLKYLGYVPEVHTDSIFAVIVEELGFVRALALLLVFLYFLTRALRVAKTAADPFGRYLASGITLLIALQLFINLMAMLGIIPLTGIPLPFISYGGSSLIVLMAGVGILLSISRYRTAEVNDK